MSQTIYPRAVSCTQAQLNTLTKNDTGRFFFTAKEASAANRKAYLESAGGLIELAQVSKVASDILASINALKGGALGADRDTLKKLGTLVTALQSQINNIDILLQSNDVNMDTVQEMVNFIKDNEADIAALSFDNLAGAPNMSTYATLSQVQSTLVASDANKLGGQAPAYYLNYNNLSNTPVIPPGADLSGYAEYTDFVTEL